MAENEELAADENQPPTDQSEQTNAEADAPDFTGQKVEGQPKAETPEQPKDKQPWDRVRQEAQQEIGNKLRPIQQKYDSELAALKAEIARLASGATPQAKDRLQELSETAQGTPIDPDESVPVVAKALRELREELRQAKAQIEEQSRRIAPAEQLGYERQWKSVFVTDSPDASAKADEAYQHFVTEYSDIVGDGQGFTPEACSKIANRVYRDVLGRYKTTAPAIEKTPAQSPKGAQIVPQGSRKAVAARGTEDDGYPDFHASDE